MKQRAALLALVALPLLAACGGTSLWPFGESENERSRKPSNATEYRCADAKTFYVRNLEGGAVWLIAPDREIRLDKQADGRYGVGKVLLEISSEGATLTDPPAVFMNCKRAG